jgi:hypothetical protein
LLFETISTILHILKGTVSSSGYVPGFKIHSYSLFKSCLDYSLVGVKKRKYQLVTRLLSVFVTISLNNKQFALSVYMQIFLIHDLGTFEQLLRVHHRLIKDSFDCFRSIRLYLHQRLLIRLWNMLLVKATNITRCTPEGRKSK